MPPASYQGNEPYIFISYAHKDSKVVYPILEKMQKDGYRIWFDDGIDPGSEWASNIERHIKESGYFISFISRNYFESDNCKDELDCARNCGIHRLLIYLEDTEVPEGINMRVSRIQAIYWNRYKDDKQQFYERLYSAENINECCGIKRDMIHEQEDDVLHARYEVKDTRSQRNTSNDRNIKIIPICFLAIVAVAAICFGIYSFSSKTAGDNADATEESLAEVDSILADMTDASEQTVIEDDETLTESNSNKSEVEEEQASIVEENVSESNSSSNVLMSDVCSNLDYASSGFYSAFYTEWSRNDIISITFLDTLEDAPDDAWDFSENGDGSVKGWVELKLLEGYELYIAADGGVEAPSDCTGLFNGYINVTSIDFGTAFHTENVTSMNAMFANCLSLKGSLDLSGFDTSNVTDMSEMFYLCDSLVRIDLSSFDTSSVANMHDMFNECTLLRELDVSTFDTSNVTDMSYMFFGCNALEGLNLRNFDTSSVVNMRGMFAYCKSLTSFNVGRFDTSNVTDMSYMFYGCPWMTLDSVANWDVSNVESYENFMDDEDYITLFE